MLIQFLGICTFDRSRTPIEVFIPDVSTGNIPQDAQNAGSRAHTSFIAVPPESVDATNWSHTESAVAALGGGTFWQFPLDGVELSVDPAPTGGTINIGLLKRIFDVTNGDCPAKTDFTPNAHRLAAHVVIPGGDLTAATTAHDLRYTEWTVDANVTITATGSGAVRTLRVRNTANPPEIVIANVDQTPPSLNDTVDRALYCALASEPPAPAQPFVLAEAVPFAEREIVRRREMRRNRRTVDKDRKQPPFTLGTGCSNTQFP